MHVFWIQGPRRQARLRLQGSFFVIGRTEPFAVFQDDPSISREHCVVVATDAGVRLKDLGSSNGVVLNGQRLGRYAEVPLAEGDELIVGRTTLRLLGEGDEAEGEQVTVDREGRSRTFGALVPPGEEPPPTDVGSVLDDDADLPGEETEELGSPVLEVGSDDEGSSDPEGLANAPTEDEEPEEPEAEEREAPKPEEAPETEASDVGLAEELDELADAAEREPELE